MRDAAQLMNEGFNAWGALQRVLSSSGLGIIIAGKCIF